MTPAGAMGLTGLILCIPMAVTFLMSTEARAPIWQVKTALVLLVTVCLVWIMAAWMAVE